VSPGPAVLVTGGAGFIGTHTCAELIRNGREVVVVDDFSNSFPRALEHVQKVTGTAVTCYPGDIRDPAVLALAFDRHEIGAVVHFAARKAVAESTRMPLEYYDLNVTGTITLVRSMLAHGVHRLVFSSSCSIYGAAGTMPLNETSPASPVNPYARSKWMCEQILTDVCARHPELQVIALRYFNPIGAHDSGLLGEDPRGIPNNIVPYLNQVAVGRLENLNIFGDDYPTPDGTCVRDYIHVVDVADGHLVALDHLDGQPGMRVLNLGTGIGTSVRELVAAFERACGRPVPVQVRGRRPGDVPELVADPALVAATWGWRTRHDLDRMCQDAWRFQAMHPMGYGG
jgi:UDP-glucose 4-epimerase